MIKENQIKHENGKFWVLEVKKGFYQVMMKGSTCSTCDSAYNDLSLAIYRCDYLAKRA